MRSNFFKLFLLITVLVVSGTNSFAQYEWEKYQTNPLNIHGTPGSWDESVVTPCVIFNPDLNRYEMWYTTFNGTYPNNGIGFAWSSDGITWTKHPSAVMTPSGSGWDAVSVGECSVIKEGNLYKIWYTGHPNSTRTPSYIGYATSTNGGITWVPYAGNPVLSPGTGWESARVEFPSVIKVTGGYWMLYTGESAPGVARTGRAFSTDGINWQKDTLNNPVLLPGAPGEWDQNNYLGNVIELNSTLYIYYTGETNPGVSGTAIGGAFSTDMGITWSKFQNNPIIQRGASGQWDNGWVETGCAVFAHNELKLYYDGGGAATGNRGRVGLATSDPLPAGTYTIGTGGNFGTIQDVFNKLETDGVAGNVTLELIDELYTAPTDSFGFKLNGPIPGAGPNSRVTIQPTENKNVVIEGSGFRVISSENTSYVTLDGVDISGPTTLTVHSNKNNQYPYNDCVDFLENSDHNVVQKITFISDDYTGNGGSVGFYTRVGFTAAADSNLIQNNFIKKGGKGCIYISSFYSPVSATGNIIRENLIGSEADSLIAWGIQIERCKNTIVENNIIQNLKSTPTIGEILNIGINSYFGNEDIIRNNIVHNLKSDTGYSCVGILLSGGTGVNNMVYNNMVYDIQSTSTQSNSRVAGIQIWNQEYPKIYFNTVYLSGNGNGANPLGSAALYIYGGFSGSPGVDLKNNIFVNTRDESPYCASAIYDYNIYNLTSDYNDLFYQTNQYNCLVRIGSTDYLTLADWQATGKDPHSVTEMPNFVAPDLHIDDYIFTLLDGGATPIVGIETDIDGGLRNEITPDIGADEFDIVGVEDETTLPTEFTLEQNYPNPFNPSTKIKYSIPQTTKVVIKVFDILGNEIATLMDEEKPVGTFELTWNAASLPSGVYFYQLKAGENISTKKMILLK